VAAPIGPGDWVECVDASTPPGFTLRAHLAVGRLYLVEWVGVVPPGFSNPGAPAIRLMGHPSGLNRMGRQTVGWAIARFRPIYRPKQEIIEALKAPVARTPKVVREKSREDA